jgi:diaminopimelate decarboxylase
MQTHAPMTQFSIEDGQILVGGMRLTRLAAAVGRTPFYVYDRRVIDERIAELRNELPSAIHLHYAIKANPMPALVSHMACRVDGLDVASAGELRVALDAGMNARNISFAGPGKTELELTQALAAGILINVESFREIRLLTGLSKVLDCTARVAVRVNPDFELKSSGMKMGGGPRPFGIDAEKVPEALTMIGESGLAFEGFQIFSGSQNLRLEAICESQTKALELALRLAEYAPAPMRVLNIGGGFGIPYFPGERRLDVAPIGAHLACLARSAQDAHPDAQLIVELGRFLVGEAGLYVCRILDRKVSRGHVFLVTDGGLHHHLAASGNFGQVIRKNYPEAIGNRIGEPIAEIASIVGPLCTPLDVLGDRIHLPLAQEGDLLVVFQSGAYGRTASPTQFLGHPPPAEIFV